MKRMLLTVLMLALMLTVFASCKPANQDPEETASQTEQTGETTGTEEVTEELDEYGRPVLKTALPSDLNYDNEEVSVMLRSTYTQYFLGDESKEATALEQALYKRDLAVQDQLNVYLKYHTVEQKGSDTHAYDTAIAGYFAGSGEMDIVTSYAYFTPALAISGYFADLNQINNLTMTSTVWNRTFADSVSYDGALYFNVGDFSVDYLSRIGSVFFNKQLAMKYFGSADILYEMVRDGSWTMENAKAMMADIHTDLNNNNKDDVDDFYAFTMGARSGPCEAIVTGMGFDHTYRDADGEYHIFKMDTALSDKIDAIHNFLASEFSAPRELWSWANGDNMFMHQNTIFLVSAVGQATHYADVDFDYGFLPMFKYDSSQESYLTSIGDSFSLQCIMANCTDKERAGAVLQCLNECSYRTVSPQYFEVLLMGRLADAPDDAEMLELLRSTVRCDFGRIYSGCLSRITAAAWNNFCDPQANYAQWYQSNKDVYEKNLEDLLISLKKGAA